MAISKSRLNTGVFGGGEPVKNQWIRAVTAISAGLLVVVSLGNGCSNNFKSINDAGSGGVDTAGSGQEGDNIIPGTKTAVLVDSNRVLSHLSTCAGVASPSDITNAVYENKKSSISSSGAANTVTAPMMMAIANISGEVCNDLINQEQASGGRIFTNVDFGANVMPTSPVLTDAITRLSLSCWQRQPSSSEISTLLTMTDSIGATEQQAARKASLMICTAMLTSLDALLN